MGRRKKIIEDLVVDSVVAEGKCIARRENMVIFITGVVPGDVVDVLITKKKKSFLEGRPIKFKSYSEERTEPFCQHYDNCGGCKWQHLPYHLQLKYKQNQVKDNLDRIAKVNYPGILPIIGSKKDRFYRNKLEFTFSNSRWLDHSEIESEEELDRRALGFHVPGRHDRIVDIQQCHLQEDPSNDIRNFLNAFAREKEYSFYDIEEFKGLLRNLVVRNSSLGEVMIIVVFGEDDKEKIEECLNAIKVKFPDTTSLNYIINTKKNDTYFDLQVHPYSGRTFIYERIGDLRFKISPKSFFQTNSYQAEALYDKTKEFAELDGQETVYDLYTGTGTIANYIAKKAKKVIGVENIDQAICDAKENAKLNNIDNAHFLTGDAKDTFNEELFNQYGKPDVLITDPPRAGMHKDVIETILNAEPKKIVYVSCNPATQARDLALLDEKYQIEKVQPVDMFPHTHHVENIVSLKLKI